MHTCFSFKGNCQKGGGVVQFGDNCNFFFRSEEKVAQKIYCPQKMGLILSSPCMYYRLLTSETGPQCARPLNMFKLSLTHSFPLFLLPTLKTSPLKIMSLESGPHCAWPVYVLSITVLRNWASLNVALLCIINYCHQKVDLNVRVL